MFSLFSSIELSSSDASRLRRVEAKLDLILKHLNLKYDDDLAWNDLAQEVRELVDRGRTIEAIKRHRELTGVGLADAKAVIDRYTGRRREELALPGGG